MPIKNRKDATKINPLAFFFSYSCKPGLINLHNSNRTYGNDKINPAVTEVQMCAENCPETVLL